MLEQRLILNLDPGDLRWLDDAPGVTADDAMQAISEILDRDPSGVPEVYLLAVVRLRAMEIAAKRQAEEKMEEARAEWPLPWPRELLRKLAGGHRPGGYPKLQHMAAELLRLVDILEASR